MRKDDITRLFPEASDEQVKALLDINSADITHALDKRRGETDQLQEELSKARAEADKAREALSKANETIQGLESVKGDAAKLQEEIERYKQAEAERIEADKKAAAQRELEERFSAVCGDKKFIHDLVRRGVMEDFGKALNDRANRGKSDAEVFDALTKDQGYFASQNPPAENMPPFGEHMGAQADVEQMSDADYYASIFNKTKE